MIAGEVLPLQSAQRSISRHDHWLRFLKFAPLEGQNTAQMLALMSGILNSKFKSNRPGPSAVA